MYFFSTTLLTTKALGEGKIHLTLLIDVIYLSAPQTFLAMLKADQAFGQPT